MRVSSIPCQGVGFGVSRRKLRAESARRRPHYLHSVLGSGLGCSGSVLQGNLAHKKQPPPLGPSENSDLGFENGFVWLPFSGLPFICISFKVSD